MKHSHRSRKSRREFLKTGIKAGMSMSLLGYSINSRGRAVTGKDSVLDSGNNRPLNILILGGTGFLGPHQVAYALGRGHNITLFNRGRTKPTIHTELFQEVEHLKGFRESDLSSLKGHRWDAVIDNSGKQAEWTRDSARLLRDSVDLYLYTSSTGVYFPYLGSDITEETDLVLKVPENINSFQAIEYGFGVMKAKSEIEAQKEFGKNRTTIVRATYMMGPADNSDRFTYWPVRLSLGGEVLVPGKSSDPVQYIDARDVASFMIRLIEARTTGVLNAVGPVSETGMLEFVHGVRSVFSVPTTYESIPDYDFLAEHNILDQVPWIIPTGENYGSARVNNRVGLEYGLTLTPLADSVRDIYEWWHSEAVPEHRRVRLVSGTGSLMSREKEIIKDWRANRKI